jgi:integrative and conjugative element protein (TIGR02256 family)
MQLPLTTVLFPETLAAKCRLEGDAHFPLETGGVLMGYHIGAKAVVTEIIGAGPEATHRTHSFEPDYDWQNRRIAEHYGQSGRHETYLGDWHTHPRALSGRLSSHDRGVIKKIIRTREARASQPLMTIFYGVPGQWEFTVWCGYLTSGWFGMSRLNIGALQVEHR